MSPNEKYIYMSPTLEQIAVFMDGKWHLYLRSDAIKKLDNEIFPEDSDIRFHEKFKKLNKDAGID